ncbi:hypothetical protein N0V88_004035 [Collariella sp. IMI 366227]|nr:hypothetical protein N0V88_004035 [Collariella sp. IMI 366227]
MVSLRALGLLAAVVVTATAQDDDESSTTFATTTRARSTNGHDFRPDLVKANVGDIIHYHQSNLRPVQPPNYQVRVNDTEPIWFYCAAPGSCSNYQMVGVINPNATQSVAKQKDFARGARELAPGDQFPTESPIPGPTSTGNPDNNHDNNDDHHGLSKGAIAGIAIGAAAILILGAALLYLCGRRGGFDKAYRKSAVPTNAAAAAAAASPAAASPPMMEATYANSPNMKSPAATGPYSDAGTIGPLGVGGAPPGYHGHPQQGYLHPQQQHGQMGYGQGGFYPSPQISPQPTVHTPFIPPPPAPVELDSGNVPPTQPGSPPPGYRGSWMPGQEGQYRPAK